MDGGRPVGAKMPPHNIRMARRKRELRDEMPTEHLKMRRRLSETPTEYFKKADGIGRHTTKLCKTPTEHPEMN